MIKTTRGETMRSLKEFEQYKMMIITMDDLIFNLNELRYDFLQLLYPKTFGNMSFQEYSKHLGTVHTMYSYIQSSMVETLNNKIETFIYDEKNLHNIILKESTDALLNLVKSKNIKVIVLTTHDHEKAKQLLAYRHLDQDIDQVISITETCKDVPSIKLFHTLANLYQFDFSELLFISSMDSLFKCIQYSPIDHIFIPDNKNSYLDPENHPTAMMASLFDVLQYALFGKYTSTDLYKEFLGYDENMNEQQKRNRYTYLKMKYENSPEILPIVDQVFSKDSTISIGEMKTQAFNEAFSDIEKKFDQMDLQNQSDPSNTFLEFQNLRNAGKEERPQIEPVEELVEDTTPIEKMDDNPMLFDSTEEFNLDHLDKTIELTKILEEPVHIPSDQAIGQMFDSIENKETTSEDEKYSKETIEEASPGADTENTNKKERLVKIENILLTALLNLLTAFIVVSFGGIIYMCFYDKVDSIWFLKAIFDIVFVGFSKLCALLYQGITSPFDSLAYENLSSVSPLFTTYIIMILVVFIVISLYKILRYYTSLHDDNYYEM